MRFAGLISGTSRDGIDAVVADIAEDGLEIVVAKSFPYEPALRSALTELVNDPESPGLARIGELHAWIGDAFAEAACAVIEESGVGDVAAIGSHGQTIHHGPDARHPYSLQIGDAARIAQRTGVQTVADFRSGDIAAGGQGAPLVPPFHRWLFGQTGRTTAVVNIGGIANVTLISDDSLLGFDTGPGNTLMDAWCHRHKSLPFDEDGRWAREGTANDTLLNTMLADAYFSRAAPKSTGFEYFNLDWVDQFGAASPEDMQATLLALSARSIADTLHDVVPDEVLVCGGGVHNTALMDALTLKLGSTPVASTAVRGLDPDWVEACAFAWLAQRRVSGQPGNAPSVTGAAAAVPLGAIYLPTS